MRCPYCHSPGLETDAECRKCGFSIVKVGGLFGAVPFLIPGLSDLNELLTARERKRIGKRIASFETRLPQTKLAVIVLSECPVDQISAYAFWLFNRGALWNELQTDGANRNILLLVDTGRAKASVVVGYGLEPFVGERHLSEALAAARPVLGKGNYAAAIEVTLGHLEHILIDLADNLVRAYGLDPKEVSPRPVVEEGVY